MAEGAKGRPPFPLGHVAPACTEATGPDAPADARAPWPCRRCVPLADLPPLRPARGHGPRPDDAVLAVEFAATYTGERPFVLAMRDRARGGAWTPSAAQVAALIEAQTAGG